ncbi:YnbE family lipoprotein [Microbulbifer sp. MCCC 1A16149]|uniref:YnbE family lipoprotein n=1 Tax=Microbulbifer sp. MCCC 1A16149 TaxID=3411322 RepID=UPI003D0E9497
MKQTGTLKRSAICLLLVLGGAVTTACTPTVAVQAPSEPITVNLNVKIEHEIRVRVDKELDDLFEDKEGIF